MMLYQKLLSAGVAVIAVAFIAVGGTGAFFSDQEASVGNAFAAGAIDIAIEDITHNFDGDVSTTNQPGFSVPEDNGNNIRFALDDLKPLDEGEVSYRLSNRGNDAKVCAMVEENDNDENGLTDPESDAGDSSASAGELQDFMSFQFGNDSGTLSDISGQWFDAGDLTAGATSDSSIGYCFGDYTGSGNCGEGSNSANDNRAQTDIMTADITFEAVQTRNNDDFQCSDLNEENEPNEYGLGVYSNDVAVVVGGANSDYQVGDTETITNAYGAGEEFTLEITEEGDDYKFVVTTPFAVQGQNLDHSASILFDADDDNEADFQYAYLGGQSLDYKVNNNGTWDNQGQNTPSYYQGVLPDHQNQEYTIIVPKTELDSTFRVAVNVTQNNNSDTGAHLQMGIPVNDLFPNNDWTTSENYLVVTP